MKKIFILAIILFASQAWGATYYVKSGGNDSAAGTSDETAWAHCPGIDGWTGSTTLNSGDTVFFRSQDTWIGSRPVLIAETGVTYDGSTYGSGTRATMQPTNNDQGTKAMVIRVYDSNVTLKGIDVDLNDTYGGGIYIGMYATSNLSNVTVDNCIVHNGDLVTFQYHYGIHVGNRNGNTISNITLKDSSVYDYRNEAIALYQGWNDPSNRTDTVLIQNCVVYGTARGVLIANDTDNVTIENCRFHNNTKSGVWIRTSPHSDGGEYSVTSGPDNFIIRYNLIYDNIQAGIKITNCRFYPEGATESGIIHNNFFWDNGTNYSDGYELNWDGSGGSNGSDYDGCEYKVYNNTFYTASNQSTNSAGTISIGWWGELDGGDFDFQNNIFYIGDTYAFVVRHNESNGTVTHTNNHYYRSDSSSNAVIWDIYANKKYSRAETTTWEAIAQNTDPDFVNVSADDYRITSGSDAIDNGADLSAHFTTDYYGNSRPARFGFDIGAHEYPIYAPVNLRIKAVNP